MRLSQQALDEFKQIYKAEFGGILPTDNPWIWGLIF